MRQHFYILAGRSRAYVLLNCSNYTCRYKHWHENQSSSLHPATILGTLSLGGSSFVPRFSLLGGKREPGNHCMRMHQAQYAHAPNTVCKQCTGVHVSRIQWLVGKGQHMRMQWSSGSLCSLPREPGGEAIDRWFLQYMYNVALHSIDASMQRGILDWGCPLVNIIFSIVGLHFTAHCLHVHANSVP